MPISSVPPARKLTTPIARFWPTPERAFLAGAALYLLLAFVAFCIVKPTTLLYFTDYWEHRAIIVEVIQHGTALVDPIYGEAATSRQFMPWSLGLGYLARETGMGPDNALTTGALLVSMLFIIGVWDFARTYFQDRWAPVVLLAVLCCCWGFTPLMWTGFYSLRSQLHSNYYPASVVFALTLIGWAQVIRLLRAPRINPAILLLLVLIVAFSLITHPLNAALLIAGALGLIIVDPQVAVSRRLVVLAALAVGMGATIFWPYFDPLRLGSQGVARGRDTFNNFSFFYSPLFIGDHGWPAFFSLLFLKNQLGRPSFRIGVIALIAIASTYFVGWIADVSITHRLLAYVFLSMHLILTRALLDMINGTDPGTKLHLDPKVRRRGMISIAILVAWQILLAGDQLVHPWSNSHYPYPLHHVAQETEKMRDYLTADARPLGFKNAPLVLPTYGIHVVAFPRPMVFSPTDDARQVDYRHFFSTGVSTAERRAIAARWGATHVVWLYHETPLDLQAELARMGPVVSPVGPWRVIVLTSR